MRSYKRILKKIFTWMMAVAVLTSNIELPATVVYAADNVKTELDISKGTIEFGYNNNERSVKVGGVTQTYDSDGYIITGTTTEYKIKVNAGTHDITLNNVDIELSGNDGPQPIYIEKGANVNLDLSGKNRLVAGADCAGLQVRPEASVTISGTGSLEVIGGNNSAGIGGGNACYGGMVTINSGEVTAIAGRYGAGIGGGNDYNGDDYGDNSVGPIIINGGTVVASGGYGGAGIGGGYSASGGTVIVTGGNVKAVGDTECVTENMADHIGHGAYGTESGTLKNGTDDSAKNLALVKLSIKGVENEGAITVAGLDEIYLKNAKLIDGELWLWLPVDYDYTKINNVNIGGMNFEGVIKNTGENIFTPINEEEISPKISLTDSLELFETDQGLYYMLGGQCRKYKGTLYVSGIGDTTYNINVESGTHHVMLRNVKIDVSTITEKCAFSIKNGASVYLYLDGENRLLSGSNCAGLQVDSEAMVTINGEGNLEVCGGSRAAGIGGGAGTSCGTVTISGGTITAKGGYYGAGIGGGYASGAGNIFITGGTIIANISSYSGGAYGIGIGSEGSLGNVVISGGNIKTNSISGTPKNSTEYNPKPVSLFTITISGLNESVMVNDIEGIGEYNLNGVTTLDTNKLYFYLPDDVQRVTQINTTIHNIKYSTANGGKLNYGFREAELRSDWSYEVVEDVIVSGIKGNDDWYTSDVIITAPEDYYIGSDKSDICESKIVIQEDMEGDVNYYLKQKETGAITEEKKIHIKRDTTAPEAKIVIGDDSFSSVCDPITYNYFHKDEVGISIYSHEAEGQSGVALVQYQKVKKNYVYDENTGWSSNDKISFQGHEAFVIYAKVTDKAGNVTIINSDGIVLYEDSVLDKNSITYTLGSEKNASIGLTLNGNTFKSIQLGDKVLVKDKDYTIEGRTITFPKSYLENLGVGTYKLNLYYNPAGEETDKIILTDSIDLTVKYKTIANVSLNLATPRAGVIIQKSIPDGTDYTGTVSWNCSGETFGYNTAYTATVTLIPNEKCAFADGIKISGCTVNYNADGSLTIAKKFQATRKAVLTSLTPPGIRKFDVYHESVDEALNDLNRNANTVVVTAEDGVMLLPVKWSFEGDYIATPGESNLFTWKADTTSYNLNAELITEGTVQIENTNVEGVVVTSKDAEIVYDGECYDVSDLFEISDHTGEETYIVKNLTGQGVLEDTDLTITKAGTFEITVHIEAEGKYNSTTATAVLTVKKGEGDAELEMEDCVYGAVGSGLVISSEDYDVTRATVIYTSVDGKGYNSSEMPVNAGEYLVTATLPANDLYSSTQVDNTFVIEPKDIEGAVITLGKELVYTGSKQMQTVASVSVDGRVLGAEDYIVTDNEAIDTEDDYTLTVIGRGNYTGSETMDFTVGKMEAPVIEDISKSYLYTVGSHGKIITIDIAELLPKDIGETTYRVTGETKDYILDPFVEEDGKLTYEIDAAISPESTFLVVTATTQNYKDISVRIHIILSADAAMKEVLDGREVGATLKDSKKQAMYKVTKAGSVEYVKPVKKSVSKVTIPETIKVDGITYKVTSIAKNAFCNHKKLKQVTIGKNVKAIGAHAFYNCKKLKNITLKTTNLTNKTVGAKAFKGIRDDATIKTPKGKQKSYEKLLKEKGVSSKSRFK